MKLCIFIFLRVVKILTKPKELLKKFLNLRDCPQKLAKSISLGFGLAFLPLPGINIPLTMILAKFLKLNIVAATLPALLLAYVSPFLYWFNYKTGAFLLNVNDEQPPEHFDVGYEDFDLRLIDKLLDYFTNLGEAYLLGSFINATIVAVLSYFIFLFIYKNTNRIIEKRKIRINKNAVQNKNGFNLRKRLSIKNIRNNKRNSDL